MIGSRDTLLFNHLIVSACDKTNLQLILNVDLERKLLSLQKSVL